MSFVDLTGRRAIVTGASQGIGAAIAIGLARCGAEVCLTARNAGNLAEVARRIVGERLPQGRKPPLTVARDLREPGAADQIVGAAVAAFGGLDIVVSNAGATKRGDFLALSDADMLDGFALKFHGAVRLTRAAWPHLVASGRGALVTIAGIGARTPSRDFTIGAPVNAALVAFTKAIADRGLADGVRVNCVHPGHVVTDRLRGRLATAMRTHGIDEAEAMARARADTGINRFGEADEIADFVAFLCSDRAGYIHGATLDIDGGATKGL